MRLCRFGLYQSVNHATHLHWRRVDPKSDSFELRITFFLKLNALKNYFVFFKCHIKAHIHIRIDIVLVDTKVSDMEPMLKHGPSIYWRQNMT